MAHDTRWLTAAELAGLPGMPGSEFRTRAKLAELAVPNRKREGAKGGGGREFDTRALPPATQRALIHRQMQTMPAADEPQPLAELVAQPVAALPAVALAAPPPTRAASECADARALLVRHLQAMADGGLGMTRATEVFSHQLAQGTAPADIMDTAAAANQRPRAGAAVLISGRTLFRWVGLYKKAGWAALVPTPTQAASVAELGDDVRAVLQAFASASGQARNLTHCAQRVTELLGRPFDDWRRLYDQARRALPKLDKTRLIKARHTGNERAAKLPFKRRDTSTLQPNDVWLVDGHTFKAKVRHPEHGQPFAPEVTIAIDAATRKIVGWSASLSESTIAVGDCIRHAVSTHGVPAIVYSDNGAGERAKVFDCPVAGLFARLGSEHRTGLPGHPQGHGLIERSWQTHMIRCARQFGSYQGGDVDGRTLRNVTLELGREQRAVKRAETSGEVVVLSAKVPGWERFLDAVQDSIDNYNNQHRHRALPRHEAGELAGKHWTPAEAWAQLLPTEGPVMLDAPTLRHLFMPAVLRTALRGEVRWLNGAYFNADLMAVDGEQVRVHYDIHNAERVWVWTTEGKFVCEAVAGANKMGYFPAPMVERAREKRVMGIVKRRELQIETAMRELTPTLPAPGQDGMTLDLADLQGPLPVPAELHDEPALAAPAAHTPRSSRPASFDTAADRFEWLMQNRAAWLEGDADWIATYAATDDYAELREYYESRGLAWSAADDAAFKHAG